MIDNHNLVLNKISSKAMFEYRQISEDSAEVTNKDENTSDFYTMILFGGLGVAALVVFLPMIVMGGFYLWMLYWFSCKGKKSFQDNSFPWRSNLAGNNLSELDYLSSAVTVANDLWSGRCG